MPLRCLDDSGQALFAFDLTPDDWTLLADANRRRRHLRLPCCQSELVLRRSRRGTQHFAHKAIGACATAPETEAHLRIKRVAVEVARSRGWHAETEVSGIGRDGESWRADVLASRGDARIAIEVQWSAQTAEETLRRQERYRQAGVRGLWLIRQRGFPVAQALPAARLIETEDDYSAVLADEFGERQRLSVRRFLEAAFDRRLRFGQEIGMPAVASIQTAPTACWHESCRTSTNIIAGIEVQVGPDSCRLTVADLDPYPDLLPVILGHVPDSLVLGPIKKRFSQTQSRSYLSNGCPSCDRIFGEFFEHDVWDVEQTTAQFTFQLTDSWRRALMDDGRMSQHWWVSSE